MECPRCGGGGGDGRHFAVVDREDSVYYLVRTKIPCVKLQALINNKRVCQMIPSLIVLPVAKLITDQSHKTYVNGSFFWGGGRAKHAR